ncbi:MAG TPA: ligase-associated DNA damage response DEXH box helicase [Caulobacterales bacterium]|nr:ligase-associated DNA damage response DEXH box helicase [Caulobacterales bacterium]
MAESLPDPFAGWFAARGWAPRAHQMALLAAARAGRSALLIAPTGGGKTLAGFLPSLIELSAAMKLAPKRRPHALHTLYISPLKALTADVARNILTPAQDMSLPLRIETRTGDTSHARRQRQRAFPPDILLTTPEQLALLIASEHARVFFCDLKAVIVDEIHSIAPTKRGDLLALGMARLEAWSPGYRRIGLSATVPDPDSLLEWLGGQEIIRGAPGAPPEIEVLASEKEIPWAGHTGRHLMGEVYQAIRRAGVTLIFVNTRAQAEFTFQELWRVNEDNLPIALHHGSLDVSQRRKVEAAMTRGDLRAVVCTSTLDLGVDWGNVDLVVQLGAPKGCSRLVQRIGRANHRLDEPSRALLAPNNLFEVLECRAAKEAVEEGALDGVTVKPGSLDVLAQHLMGVACGEAFEADTLYDEVRAAAPYRGLGRDDFDRLIDVAATGGYALRAYDRYRRIVQGQDGLWRVRNREVATQHRLNIGTIIESEMLDVRLVGRARDRRVGAKRGQPGQGPIIAGRKLGKIEEYFIEGLTPGDTFLFAGQILRFEGLSENDVLASRARGDTEPKIPSYAGGKFPLSTFLAARVRALVRDPSHWRSLPDQVAAWLMLQQQRSIIPQSNQLLVETFPRGVRYHLVCYPFEGRLAHQTLGMLLTRRLERLRKRPLGFVASEYAVSVWALSSLRDVDMNQLFDEDMLGDDLDAWLAESNLMKRTFRNCAIIAGLIARKHPNQEKSGRQVTFSTDLLYDVLRRHQPDHILLEAAFHDAGEGMLDIRRLGDLLARAKDHIVHVELDRISPFAVPVMMEIGRESVDGEARDAILEDAAADFVSGTIG